MIVDIPPPRNISPQDAALFNKYEQYSVPGELNITRVRLGFINQHGFCYNAALQFEENSALLEAGKKTHPNLGYFIGNFLFRRFSFHSSGPYILAYTHWSENYFHWMTDTLPRLMLLTEGQLRNATILLPDYFRFPFVKETLKVFSIDKIQWIKKKEVIIARDVLIPPFTAETGFFNPQIVNKLSLKIRSFYKPASADPYKIYVSRKKAGKRKVENEDMLEALLEAEGYKCICFEDMDFSEQVLLMHNCTHFISIHGAGLTNMLFMAPGSKAMEIRKKGEDQLNCYFLLAGCLGIEYFYHLCDPSPGQDYTHTANLLIDIEKFKEDFNQFDKVN